MTPAGSLRLRPFRAGDETAARAAHEDMQREGFPFLLDYAPGDPWMQYVSGREAHRRGEDLPEGWVPHTFLAAVVGDELVGRISIRHRLSHWLATYGGHIGYGIVPAQRRRGYATELLRQGLIIARSVDIDEVLVICHDDNVASARVIEANGGEFESMIAVEDAEEPPRRRYWIR